MYVAKQWEISLLGLLLLYNADEIVLSGLCQKSAVTHRVYLLQCKASSFSQLCLVALCNILHYVVWTCSPALAESIAKSDCHAVRQREKMTEEWNPIFLKLRKTQANEQQQQQKNSYWIVGKILKHKIWYVLLSSENTVAMQSSSTFIVMKRPEVVVLAMGIHISSQWTQYKHHSSETSILLESSHLCLKVNSTVLKAAVPLIPCGI